MKYLFLLISLFTLSCKAQIISLEVKAQCLDDPDNCPNFNYVKDINGSLNKYIGTCKGIYDGLTYEIQFKKGLYEDFQKKRDIIIGRLQIKDANGNTLYNTLNEPDDNKTKFSGLGFQPDLKAYRIHFSGGKSGCIDYGSVYLIIKPSTPNHMTLDFVPDSDIVIEGECTSSFVPTLPYRKTIDFIKQ